MFARKVVFDAPALSYGQIIKKIKSKDIKSIYVKPGTNVVVYETDEGTRGQASIVANDYFIEKAVKNDVDLIIQQPDPKQMSAAEFITTGLGLAILFSIVSNFIQIQSGGGGGTPLGLPSMGGQFEIIQETGIYFENVAGIDEATEELKEIVSFLRKPEMFTEMGASVPRGCLLNGPPGTGKTLLAKAIAGEAGVPFIATSASQFVELFVGMGSARIRALFKKAREVKPCIIFIDEIDAIGKARSKGIVASGGNDEREQTLNQLLLEMDGFGDNDGIIILGATNRVDIMDEALLRSGRFDRKVTLGLPDADGREKILNVHAKNKKIAYDVDLKEISRVTPGCNGADLASIMNEAAIMAVKASSNVITSDHLYESVDKITLGVKSKRKVPYKTRKLVAYHEAGHALMSIVLNGPESVEKITIVPRGSTGGVTRFAEEDNGGIISKQSLKTRLVIAMGGTVAEELALGSEGFTTGASGDLESIESIARAMVNDFGMGSGKFVTERDVDEEIQNLINDAYKTTRSLMKIHRNKLEEIVTALLTKETLVSRDILSMVGSTNPLD